MAPFSSNAGPAALVSWKPGRTKTGIDAHGPVTEHSRRRFAQRALRNWPPNPAEMELSRLAGLEKELPMDGSDRRPINDGLRPRAGDVEKKAGGMPEKRLRSRTRTGIAKTQKAAGNKPVS